MNWINNNEGTNECTLDGESVKARKSKLCEETQKWESLPEKGSQKVSKGTKGWKGKKQQWQK